MFNYILQEVYLNMKNRPKMKKTRNVLGGLFLSMLLLFTVVVSADTEDVPVSEAISLTSSAGAEAIAMGNEVTASTQVVTTGDRAYSSATAEAIASDGETATATAEVWAQFADVAYAYAQAVATAVAEAGQTVHAYARADALALSDGTAIASACISAGSGDNACKSVTENSDNSGKGNSGIFVAPRPDTISGFIFGASDAERYCTYKLQLEDEDSSNNRRAEYYLNIIAWDYGFKQRIDFENKYDIKCDVKIDTESQEVVAH